MKIHILLPLLGLTAAFVLLASPHALAQTWDGGGTNGNWTTATNWVGDVAPVANASLVFAGSTRTDATNNFAADTVFNLIRFDGAASAFNLSGNRIGLGVANDSSGNIRWSTVLTGPVTQTISADINLGTGGRSINVPTDATLLLSGNISGSDGLTKLGAATLVLTGNNSFTGNSFTISVGTVQVSSIGNSNASSAAGATARIIVGANANTATLALAGSSAAQSSDKQITVGNNTAGTAGGAIIRNDNANAAHTLTFSAAILNVSAGNTLPNTTRTLTFGGVNTGNNTVAGIISNNNASAAIALTKADAGTWILGGANIYTGGTTISGGMLQFAKTNAMPVTGAVAVGTGTTLAVNAGGTDEFTSATSGGGSIGGLLSGVGGQGAAVNYTGNVSLGIDTANASGGTITYAGSVANVGTTLALRKLGANTLVLTGNNTYTGGTTISRGTLQFAATNSMSATGAVAVETGATLAINAGGAGAFTSATSGAGSIGGLLSGLGGQGAAVNYTGNVTLGIDTTGGNVTYAGSMANVGTTLSLHKLGSLRLTLNGNNTFTGATTVSGTGTLDLARVGGQSLGSTTSVTVNSGATLLLSQSDQVNNAATVTLSGGTIRNTNAGGIGETFGNLNLTAASFLDFGNGLGNNVMNFGTYAGGGFKLTVQDFAAGNVLTFKTDLTTSINNTSLFEFSNAFTSGWNGGTSTFTITAIPEPSTYVAALGLAGLMLWPLRRRLPGLGRLRLR